MTGAVPGVRRICKDADFDTGILIKQENSRETTIRKRVRKKRTFIRVYESRCENVCTYIAVEVSCSEKAHKKFTELFRLP